MKTKDERYINPTEFYLQVLYIHEYTVYRLTAHRIIKLVRLGKRYHVIR